MGGIRKRLFPGEKGVSYVGIARTDLKNRLRFGSDAPKYAERVFVDPRSCDEVVIQDGSFWSSRSGRSLTGQVVPGDWDTERAALNETPKFAACQLHWEEDVPWADTGIYEFMLELVERRPGKDGCYNLDDIVARYQRLDSMFEQVRREGALRSVRDFVPGFRELGGVYVHFDRMGKPLFGRGGWHRLAAARVVGLPSIPVQVGMVHPAGIEVWRESASHNYRVLAA